MKKYLVAVAVSALSVNASADASGLDAIRDNLKDMYNNLSTGSWVGSVHTDARGAIESLAQHTDELSRTTITWSLTDGIGVKYTTDYDQDVLDGKVAAVTNGVLTDLFGTSDTNKIGDKLFTTDTNGRLSTNLHATNDLLYTLVDTELDELNTAMDSGNIGTIDTAITDFGAAVSSFNADFVEFYGTDKGLLEGIDSRQDALSYGVYWSAAESAFIAGSGDDAVCYDSYADYAKGTVSETKCTD